MEWRYKWLSFEAIFLFNGVAVAYYRYSVPLHSTSFHSGDTPRLFEHHFPTVKARRPMRPSNALDSFQNKLCTNAESASLNDVRWRENNLFLLKDWLKKTYENKNSGNKWDEFFLACWTHLFPQWQRAPPAGPSPSPAASPRPWRTREGTLFLRGPSSSRSHSTLPLRRLTLRLSHHTMIGFKGSRHALCLWSFGDHTCRVTTTSSLWSLGTVLQLSFRGIKIKICIFLMGGFINRLAS